LKSFDRFSNNQEFQGMGVEPKIGGKIPPKWMVKMMENPINPWMIWGGKPIIFGNTHIPTLNQKDPFQNPSE